MGVQRANGPLPAGGSFPQLLPTTLNGLFVCSLKAARTNIRTSRTTESHKPFHGRARGTAALWRAAKQTARPRNSDQEFHGSDVLQTAFAGGGTRTRLSRSPLPVVMISVSSTSEIARSPLP